MLDGLARPCRINFQLRSNHKVGYLIFADAAGHEMSVWPQQVLSPARRGHEPRPFGRDKEPHRAPLWLLLAGIIVIGIGIGLFATSITAILLASSAAQAADPTGGCALPHPPPADVVGLQPYEFTEVSGVGYRDIHHAGRYDEF